jgi:hypothetical protein
MTLNNLARMMYSKMAQSMLSTKRFTKMRKKTQETNIANPLHPAHPDVPLRHCVALMFLLIVLQTLLIVSFSQARGARPFY